MPILEKEIKAQPLRLFDVVILAPFLLYAGTRKQSLSPVVKRILVLSSFAIFSYELKNFLEIQKLEAQNAS